MKVMKPTLLILAAGLSSRYKLGLKQNDKFGPSGEILLDYAIYDAIKAGFGKVVFVIRKNTESDFEKLIAYKYKNIIKCDFVFQELDNLPDGFNCPDEREKPWGTGHAVWVAKDKIKEPFAVINADDFYGSDSFSKMAKFLSSLSEYDKGNYAMVGYNLKNTLSDHGTVSRGICDVKNGVLQGIIERSKIQKKNGLVIYIDSSENAHNLDQDAIVSMNFWGFTPDIFSKFENSFRAFLNYNIQDIKSEFYLPYWVNGQINDKDARVTVLNSNSRWIGVTYPEDKAIVVEKLKSFASNGTYPARLINNE
jgi:UTP-glucose-1-phosphate uridylyltransferase